MIRGALNVVTIAVMVLLLPFSIRKPLVESFIGEDSRLPKGVFRLLFLSSSPPLGSFAHSRGEEESANHDRSVRWLCRRSLKRVKATTPEETLVRKVS